MRWVLLAVALLSAGCKKAGDRKVTVDGEGFHPSHLELKKGGPGDVTFLRTSDATCAKQVVFKDLGLKKDLPLDAPVTIQVPTDQARTLTFACGMGMFESTLVVE